MKSYKFLVLIVTGCMVASCARYLDVKPNQSLATPTTVQSLQALLDNETTFNQNYPAAGDIASDYYYLDDASWRSVSVESNRLGYIWDGYTDQLSDWRIGYQSIFVANVVLDHIHGAALGEASEHDRDRVKGAAHFFRGWRYFLLAQLYAPHYRIGVNDGELGLPMRLDPDINLPSIRNTLAETYEMIVDDLNQAVHYLPESSSTPTRPSKAAAYAAMARVSNVLGDWESALHYAESCLSINSLLIDYKQIDLESGSPFKVFGAEVLLHHTLLSSAGVFNASRAKVDSVLYASYTENDLRRGILFRDNMDGSHGFKGSYSGNPTSAQLFSGLATDEVYLIKAEALVRLGRDAEALEVLNDLLVKRYDAAWKPYVLEDTMQDLLLIILHEREKSLAFRGGIRWSDLRRLNTEERFAKTLERVVDGETFVLPPGDPRYTFLIPSVVIQETGMSQNNR